MDETILPMTRVDNLLAQDAAVASFQFEEFRMRLDASLKRLENRARVVRRASLCGLGILIACILSAIPLQLFGLAQYDWVGLAWAGCGLVAMFTTAVLTGIYQYRYRPALARTRDDLQAATIAHLQEQVAALDRKLNRQPSS